MTTLSRWMRASVLIGVAVTGLASCSMNVDNPSVIDAGKFNPNSDGATLALSAQTNFYMAFQSVAMFGGLISDEVWTGAVRLQTNRLSARNFVATDDINADFFALLSLAIASNQNAVAVLGKGPNASTDLNLATAAMNLGFSLDLTAETMCSSVIQGGPELSDTQLLDTAVTAFTQAIAVASAAGPAGANIVNGSNVGLARAYLQMGDFANAAATAALVPSSFVINVVTSANVSTQGSLGNTYFGNALQGQIIAPQLYRIGDPRMPIDSTTPGSTLNQLPYVIQAKYTSYGDPIRLGSGLEAQYIVAEAELHGSGATGDAVALINTRRAAGGEDPYAGSTSDTLAVLGALLNERARDFWMEGKKLGDLRRNPSVPLTAVLTDAVGAPFYTTSGGGPFGSTFCAPIPPEETNANPNF